MEKQLPFIEPEFVDRGAGIVDERAAADGVDENVDAAEFVHRLLHNVCRLAGVEGVGHDAFGFAATLAHAAHHEVNVFLTGVNTDNGPAFFAHDL